MSYLEDFLTGTPNAYRILPDGSTEEIEILCFPATDINRQQMGSGFVTPHYRIYTEAQLNVGDQIRLMDGFQGGVSHDIYVKSSESGVDIEDNQEAFRVYICA